ncbi:MAG: sigma-70 family RNA polymerase sigma factor [Planctomycetes bacterium]|nr:sigma-70 family RNA polymerase sigma factor [Planctomycetota bacterium]
MTDDAANPDAQLLQELVWVRELARRLLADEAQVDDVVQEAWVAARQQPRSFLRTNWRAWLAAVVRNRIRRVVRTERRRTRREQHVARAPVVDSTLDVLARGEVHRELMVAVMDLEEPYRSAVLLRFLDGLSGEEIACRQGISPVAARKRVSRGLQMLRERLGAGRVGGFAAWRVAWLAHGEPAPIVAAPAVTLAGKLLLAAALFAVLLGAWAVMPPGPDAAPTSPSVATDERVARLDGTEQLERVAATLPDSVASDGVRVVDEAGRAAPGVTAMALAQGRLLSRSVSDDAGLVAAPPPGTEELLLAAEGAMPSVWPWPVATRRLVFAAGARLAGTATMPAGSATTLHLHHDRIGQWAARVSDDALEVLQELGITPDRIVVPLAGDGAFAIRGLPDSWSGRITLADGWTVRGPRGVERGGVGSSLILFEPREDLRLEAIPPVFVRGCLTCAGAPVAGLPVQAVWWSSFGTAAANAVSDVDGRFELGVGRSLEQAGSRIRLIVAAPGGGTILEQELALGADSEQIEIGTFELGAPLCVRVRDRDGRPIAAARVAVPAADGALLRGETDDAGVLRFAFRPRNADHVAVQARGFRTGAAPLEDAAEVTVTLMAGNGLDVVIVARPGDPTRGLRLCVEADRVPFALDESSPRAESSEPFRSFADPHADGRVELPSLVPGVMLHLGVCDALGRVVARQDVVAPNGSRIGVVELRVPEPLYELRGCVRSEDGRPVANADVRLECDDHVAVARSGIDGCFAFGAAQATPCTGRLIVDHPLFASFTRATTVQPGGEALALTLRPARVLRVRVLRPGGAAVRGCHVEAASQDGGLLRAAARGENYYFDRMDPGGGAVTAYVGGRAFATRCAPGQDVVDVHVPELGQLLVDASTARVTEPMRLAVQIQATDADGRAQVYPLGQVGAPAGGRLQLDLLPGAYEVQLLGVDDRTRATPRGAVQTVHIVEGRVSAVVLPGPATERRGY